MSLQSNKFQGQKYSNFVEESMNCLSYKKNSGRWSRYIVLKKAFVKSDILLFGDYFQADGPINAYNPCLQVLLPGLYGYLSHIGFLMGKKW